MSFAASASVYLNRQLPPIRHNFFTDVWALARGLKSHTQRRDRQGEEVDPYGQPVNAQQLVLKGDGPAR